MDKQLLSDAVADLLKYCGDIGHELDKGRQLGPVLLGRLADEGGRDDGELAEKLETKLKEQLEQSRQNRKTKLAATSAPTTPLERVQLDFKTGDQRLQALSVAWAYYIERLNTAELAETCNVSSGTIRNRFREGCDTLANLIAREECTSVSSSQADGQQQGQHNGVVPAVADDGPAPPSKRARTSRPTGTEAQPQAEPQRADNGSGRRRHIGGPRAASRIRYNEQHFFGDGNLVFNSPVIVPVTAQVRGPTADHDPSASDHEDMGAKSDRLELAILLLATLWAGWLISVAPRISVGVMVALSIWRAAVHVWSSVREWERSGSREDNWWHICYMAPWLALCGWSTSTASTLPRVLATPAVSFERLTLITRCLCIGGLLCLLGTIDVLFWVNRAPAPNWPWRLLKSRAVWAWQQRWLAVGLGCFIVIATIFSTEILVSNLGAR